MKLAARVSIFALAMTTMAAPAFPQQFLDRNGIALAGRVPPGSISIQATVSMSVPADPGQEDGGAQIEKAQKTFYQLAAGQCSLVLASIADDCQITGMNNNVDLNRNVRNESARNDVIIRGTVSMVVKLKANATAKP